MKFRINVRSESGEEWWEEYDEDVDFPKRWAKDMVKMFNDMLCPGEERRSLLAVEVIDRSNGRFHRWVKRTDGMSVMFRGSVVDMMRCERCGITGKRFGVRDKVVIDSRYRGKAYSECDTAREKLSKARSGRKRLK